MFYSPTQSPQPNPSPNSIQRYARYRSHPVNLSPNPQPHLHPHLNPTQPVHSPRDLSHSNIYTKQGWDGVKLTEYVTEQISENYIQNQRILQRFRKQAEINRRNLKLRHAMQPKLHNMTPQQAYQHSMAGQFLPVIRQSQQMHSYMPISVTPAAYNQQNQQQQYEEQAIRYRNVGVNTNKMYEKIQLQKYIRLRAKYDSLKNKYNKQKEIRRKQARKYQQQQIEQQQQAVVMDNIKDIQHELLNISMKLQANNSILADRLRTQPQQKQQQSIPQTQSPAQNAHSTSKVRHSRLKTEPVLPLVSAKDKYTEAHQNSSKNYSRSNSKSRYGTDRSSALSQLREYSERAEKLRAPTVVYSVGKGKDLLEIGRGYGRYGRM